MTKKLLFSIGSATYHAALKNNRLSEKIALMCPFTLNYTRSGEHEYYAALPQKINAEDCEPTTSGHRNGLYYFEGWNALSVVFNDCSTAPFKIHHIGDFDEDISSVLVNLGDSIQIICEAE